MAQRDELFRKFGPLIIEAFMLMTVDAINELRVKAMLTPFTKEQTMTRLDQILSSLELYDWMKEK